MLLPDRRSAIKSFANKSIVLVGNSGVVHVGSHLLHAAQALGLNIRFCDTNLAFDGPFWLTKFNWLLRGHRPNFLRKFGAETVRICEEVRPAWMLSTGLAPLDQRAVRAIRHLGVQCLNYLTDDPWNPAHRAPWFMKALPLYDWVFSPRRANIEDLRKTGCPHVSYLPFAYATEVHFAEALDTPQDKVRFSSDVVFVGGADADRLPYVTAVIQAGFKLLLYGNYWERFSETKLHARGEADSETLRKSISGAKVALCLVRRANRDGNSMRTFEVPAIGACMLVEDTDEHREIFGEDEKAVVYFRTVNEMVVKLGWLLAHEEERQRLAQAAYHTVIRGRHAYEDRLIAMLTLSLSSRKHRWEKVHI